MWSDKGNNRNYYGNIPESYFSDMNEVQWHAHISNLNSFGSEKYIMAFKQFKQLC